MRYKEFNKYDPEDSGEYGLGLLLFVAIIVVVVLILKALSA
jgi:hypothetical protein